MKEMVSSMLQILENLKLEQQTKFIEVCNQMENLRHEVMQEIKVVTDTVNKLKKENQQQTDVIRQLESKAEKKCKYFDYWLEMLHYTLGHDIHSQCYLTKIRLGSVLFSTTY